MDEPQKSKPDTIETDLADIKDWLERIENLLKKSRRSARFSYFSSIGLTVMVAGMALVAAKPEFTCLGLSIFVCGLAGSVISLFSPSSISK
jgi:hypothetical protein